LEPTPTPDPVSASTRDEAIRAALDAIAAGDLDRGIELAQQVNALEPNSNIGLHLVGLISLRLNEPGKAVDAFEAARAIAPEVREHIDALAIVFSKTGRLVDSLFYGKLAVAATKDTGIPGMLPDWLGTFDEAFYKIDDRPLIKQGQRQLAVGDYAGACEAFRREIEMDSKSVEGWRGFTQALLSARRSDDALVASGALLSLTDRRAEDLALHELVLASSSRFDEAMVAGREAEALVPDDATIAWRTVQAQGRNPAADPAALAALAESWGTRFLAHETRPSPAASAEFAHRRVRLGVMSGHWAHGEGLDLLLPIFELLDRRRVELFVYADGLVDAPLARRLRTRSNVWQDLTDLDAETAGFMVRNDNLDVLIDLDDPFVTNHAATVAQAPAPIVLTLYADPALARGAGFTGVIGDPVAFPAVLGQPGLVLVEGGLVAQPSDLPPLDPDGLPTAGDEVTFGTVAAAWQIDAATLAAWRDILADLPGSVLLLDVAELGGEASTRRIADQLPHDRLSIREPGPIQEYLAAVDLLLDPIGNGFADGIVAAAAQGVPGLTCRARRPRANLAAAWLERAGLPDLVAQDTDDYRRKAVAAATDPGLRRRLADLVIADRDAAAARQAERLLQALAQLVNSPNAL
jgi:tetratricopeptide (TPR) repeat protein